MKVALTVWEDRVSPVFDSAQTLLVVEIERSKIINMQYELFNPELPQQLVQMLIGEGVAALICGAVSEAPANLIEASGVELISFIAGNAEKVLENYAQGSQLINEFSMPGCGRNPHCRRKHRHSRVFQDENLGIMPERENTLFRSTGKRGGGCGGNQNGVGKMGLGHKTGHVSLRRPSRGARFKNLDKQVF